MARTTASAVQVIIPITIDETILDAMITTANLIVTSVLGSTSLSDELLADIEKWLSAHFVYMSVERQVSKRNIEDTGETYGRLGMQLEATTYGQMVLSLDTTGRMNGLGKKAAKIEAITSFE